MEKVNFIDSEDYLKRIEGNGGKISENSLQESLKNLEIPLKEISYLDSGTEIIEVDNLKINLEYSLLDEESRIRLFSFVEGNNTKSHLEKEFYIPENWRILESLEFITDDSTVEIKSILPDSCLVLFYPSSTESNGVVFSSEKSHTIFIIGDIATPRSIITLLHEIGHIFDYRRLDELGVDKLTTDDHRYSEQAEILRKERVASAFAFKAIRPYLARLGIKDDAINFLKHYALASYYEWTKDKIREDISMDRWAMSEYGGNFVDEFSDLDQRIDDFYEWRKTEAFLTWKEMPENKYLDYSDEFSEWSKWVDSTGYDYYKDLA